ncbi:MAG: glycosyltransferase family 2 protein [Planctomycetota bacterium]|jgi:GT2 family glycosyltransferase
MADAAGPVTVSVTNWNGAAFLDDCLDGLLAMRGDVAEIIVVDNASTDDSAERVRRRGAAVRLVSMERNDGPCPARNRGLAEARTRWVLQIDSDVIVRPDTLERLLPETALPDVVVVQPRAVLAGDPDVVHYDGGRMHYVGMMSLDNLLVRAPKGGAAEDTDAVISMALLLDREAVQEAGGWDEAFFILFEDHDLSYRLRARGGRLRRVPGAIVLHREGTAGLSFRPGAPTYPARRALLHARNRPYLVLKNYSWPAIFASFPGRCAYALVYLVFAAKRGVLGSYLRGRWELLGLLPRAMRLRRLLAGRRVVSDHELLVATDLSISPVIARSRLEARLEKTFNIALRAWWRVARCLLPRGHGPR